MRQPKHYSLMRPWLLAIVMIMMAMAVPPALASNFTVTGNGNQFTIRRTDASKAEKVYFRTMSVTAVDGVHFTGKSGSHTFPAGESTPFQFNVNEAAESSLDLACLYQTGNDRVYRVEVLDESGNRLAYLDRTITYNNNYTVPNCLNKSITDLIYFNNFNDWASGGNRYLDVYNPASQNGYIQVTDGGYNQRQSIIDVTPLYAGNTLLRDYYTSLNCKIYATIGFTQKEEQDGYQYIQILADNSSTYDGNDPNGAVNTPSTSLYKACFILSYDPSGSVMTSDHKQFFPHRYDYVDKAAEQADGLTRFSFDYDNSHLYQQAYKAATYKAPTSGSLVLPMSTRFLSVRFDAAGSGGDNWDFKDLFARLAIVDETAPARRNTPVLSPGPYRVGSTFTVTVPFNEMMDGSGTLSTTWGTMTYSSGAGTNALTFQGTIRATHGTALTITGYNGIQDLAGNAFSGSISATFNNATAVARYTFDSATGALTLNWGEFNRNNKWGEDVPAEAVTSVTATAEVRFTSDCSNLFYSFNNCTSMVLGDVNTGALTNMDHMFYGCSSLRALDLSGWNTASVNNMSCIFYNCSNLTTLNLSGWNTASVTNMTDIFYNCSSLTTLDISDWNTARVTDMTGVFKKCSSLTTLDLSGWNTAKVTSMRHMFYDCSSLNTIYASSAWSTAKVTESEYMFNGCTNLVGGMGTTYDTGHTNAEYARYDRGADEPGYLTGVFTLTLPDGVTTTTPATLSHGGVDYYKGGMAITLAYTPPEGTRCRFTVGGTDIEGDTFQMPFADSEVGIEFQARYTFDSETGTLTLNWGEFNKDNKWGSDVPAAAVKSVTASADVSFTGSCYNLFYNFTNCTSMDLGDANTDALTSMYCMFYNCSSLTTLDLSGWNTANVTDMGSMFNGCSSLTTLDISGWNIASVNNMNSMFYGCSSLTTLDISNWNTASVTDMSSMFQGCSSLTTLDLSGWNTANVAGMGYMFYNCSNLTTLNLSGWNTAGVTDMRDMFEDCSSLTTLDISNWNTASVTYMSSMFEDCSSLTTLDLSGWNTASVTYMDCMFLNCQSLTTLDLSDWNTASVKYMGAMFNGCSALTVIYAGSDWTTEQLVTFDNMFNGCTNLVGGNGTAYDASHVDAEYARIDRPGVPGYFTETLPRYTFDSATGALTLNWGEFSNNNKWGNDVRASAVTSVAATAEVSFTGDCSSLFSGFSKCTSFSLDSVNTQSVTNMSNMFDNCQSLTALDISGWNTQNVTYMRYMFFRCSGLTTLDIAGWNTQSVTNMGYMFSGCLALTALDLSGWNTQSVTSMNNMFSGCEALTSLNLAGWNTQNVTDMSRMFDGCSSLTTLDLAGWNTQNVTYMSYMFSGCSSLTSLDIARWNTQSVTSMNNMFSGCSSLTSLDIAGWNTQNVTGMSYMFDGCSSLTSLDIAGWNTQNVTGMSYMFADCSALTALDLSGWNPQNITGMSHMFNGCSSLTSLDLARWNTQNVIRMDYMFYNCEALTSLDIAGWNTQSVDNMVYMFYNCKALTALDLAGWKTQHVKFMNNMFNGCSSLATIYAGTDWTTVNVTGSNDMFTGCTNLVGGNGTTYDASHVDAEYARIDRPDLPGYFTEKSALALGDLNGDGNVDVIDVSILIDFVLEKGVTIADGAITDLNGDGNVDVIDVSLLIDIILDK